MNQALPGEPLDSVGTRVERVIGLFRAEGATVPLFADRLASKRGLP